MSEVPARVVLKQGREKSARLRHPWVYSGAVEAVEGPDEPGTLADLYDSCGEFLARGFANPRSKIVFRTLSLRKEAIDREFLRARLSSAVALRRDLFGEGASAVRLVHGEGDGLPGLVVDRYGEYLVVQIGAAGMERLREPLLEALEAVFQPRGTWERSDGPARRDEGLEARSGPMAGAEPPERVVIDEGGVRYAVDVRGGHKTGFYLDQRPARALVRSLARGRRVLDVFAGTGAFAVAAAAGGAASVEAIESSAASLALLPEHLALNDLPASAVCAVAGDAFQLLREPRGRFDLVIVDPPPFAKRKAEVAGACRGYKDVNLHAMKLLSPGGFLLTSSCSHHVDPWLFQQVLFGAARDAGRALQIVARMGQPGDHPVSIHHPEGEYLKVFLLRAMA